MTTNEELLAIYERSGLTRSQLADWLGISDSTLGNYLRRASSKNRRRCPVPVVRLARTLEGSLRESKYQRIKQGK